MASSTAYLWFVESVWVVSSLAHKSTPTAPFRTTAVDPMPTGDSKHNLHSRYSMEIKHLTLASVWVRILVLVPFICGVI